MKTSELKRIVEKNWYEFEKRKEHIFIKRKGVEVMGLGLHCHTIILYTDGFLKTNQIKNCMVALIEYSLTPLNEREDEKKYEIQNTCSYRYDWGEERLSLYLVKESELYVYRNGKRQYFTQSEIDNFPKEIKGAIECGFLRKVEVE